MTIQTDPATEQRRAALRQANTVRTSNRNARLAIRQLPRNAGRDRVIAVLTNPNRPDFFGAMTVRHLLGSVRGVGTQRIGFMLKAAQVENADRRIRELTPRQCHAVAEALARAFSNQPPRVRSTLPWNTTP